MIVVAGLTPAWQQIMCFDSFRAGEVNRAREVHWCASGKVSNAAIAVAHLGGECKAVAMAGGTRRAEIESELDRLGVRHHLIESQSPTRTCTTVLDRRSGGATELVEEAGPVTQGELDRFVDAYQQAVSEAKVVILTGSLPKGAPPQFPRDLLSVTPCPAILDLRGEELICALACQPLVVKPNRHELGLTVGGDLATDTEMHRAVQRLRDGGASWVIVTAGPDPVWVSGPEGDFRVVPPRRTVVNPIGSGDCVAGGIAWGLDDGREVLEAIRLGLAAGIDNVESLLPGRLNPASVLTTAESLRLEPV